MNILSGYQVGVLVSCIECLELPVDIVLVIHLFPELHHLLPGFVVTVDGERGA